MSGENEICIEECAPADLGAWVALRSALWTEEGGQDLFAQAQELIGRQGAIVFLARARGGATIGFAEATLRRDYVNGCATSPVVFLEGLYVSPGWRRRGV